ncbi:hypothetical protein LTR17_018350 [Elasticomyces elasticus]|nr:hypothetical protein LTR17_018350 [Elasticomyces elasticus]
MHPGELRQKRFSSVGTADVPLQLLKKRPDQGDGRRGRAMQPAHPAVAAKDRDMWKDCNFSFPTSAVFPPKVTIDADIEAIYGSAGNVEPSEQTYESIVSAITASYDAGVKATECD